MKASSRRSRIRAEEARQLQFDDTMTVSEVVVQTSDREDEFGPLAGTQEWRALAPPVRQRITQKRTARARGRRAAELETGRNKKRVTW